MIHETHPSKYIESEWLETYNTEKDVIAMQLAQLNSNLFILERIENFPFKLLLITPNTFWDLTKLAYVQASISTLYRVALDKNSKVLTLSRFHNHVKNHLRADISSDDRKAVNDFLAQFEIGIKPYVNQVNRVRHNIVAHLNYGNSTQSNPLEIPIYPVSLATLKDLADKSRKLFDSLCFGFGFHTWLGGYGSSLAKTGDTDIDKLLDLVAKNNSILNMPEEQTWLWESTYRDLFSNQDMEILNALRRRCGKPEVD